MARAPKSRKRKTKRRSKSAKSAAPQGGEPLRSPYMREFMKNSGMPAGQDRAGNLLGRKQNGAQPMIATGGISQVQPMIQMSGSPTTTMPKPAPIPVTFQDFMKAGQAKLRARKKADATRLYKEAIAIAVKSVTPPPGITDWRVPTAAEINVNLDLSSVAETDQGKVASDPGDIWKWMTFGSETLKETEIFTHTIIYHELIHVVQFQEYWRKYQALPLASRPDWLTYFYAQVSNEKLVGPMELEAHLASFNSLDRMSGDEQEHALEFIFQKYSKTLEYVQAPGEKMPVTVPDATKAILDYFHAADPSLQMKMSSLLWASLVALLKNKAYRDGVQWRKVLTKLKKVADPYYQDTGGDSGMFGKWLGRMSIDYGAL